MIRQGILPVQEPGGDEATMTPIIYSTTLVDLTRDFSRCDMTPGTVVELHAVGDGRIAVRARRRARWFVARRRAVVVGFLDKPNAELVRRQVDDLGTCRVRVVSAAGCARKPTNVAISVWGTVAAARKDAVGLASKSNPLPARAQVQPVG
jgi:hypothetical protein